MLLGLSKLQEKHFREEFALSYHLRYLDHCVKNIPLEGLNVLEVGGSLPVSLVIDHLRCNTWTTVEAPSYDQELGQANQFHRNHSEQISVQSYKDRYRQHYCNIEDLGSNHNNQYDLIFSIACFEHINRLPLAIEKMLQYLKPGGKLFTIHSPIWSSFDGHHLPINIPSRFDKESQQQSFIFRPWGHLLQSRSQTYVDLCNRFDKNFAEEVIYNTYNSNHINRYFSEDYFTIFNESDFNILHYQTVFPKNPEPRIQKILESKYLGYNQFGNNGIFAILQKPYAPINSISSMAIF
tara:strand:+ start:724 stop:1605 length:882 start_codon:yes stop_codon:yes gene_type:complete